MENPGVFNFEVGQLAEMRTFEHGYRGAWFRCKIKEIQLRKNMVWLEYYDFDSLELSWEKIYQVPPYLRKSNATKKLLMVRPPYPLIYREGEMPPLNTMSQVCVIINGTWKAGDLVDWFEEGCYWSARIIKLLSGDKVQIELPMPPSGEGKEGEEGRYEALCTSLRPSLDWSETKGWTFRTLEGETPCDAQLIFPTNQGEGMDLEAEPEQEQEQELPAAGSTTRVSGERDGDNGQTEISVEMDSNLMESSESVLSLQKKVGVDEEAGAGAGAGVRVKVERGQLNVDRERMLEAALIDLEGLVNKVNWMQRLLNLPSTVTDGASTWKIE